ncbi:hypothetical protein [uncultured Shewanella sp.]|uniref:hypothetical protein n=1 Tax=Shewanella atlantica TaxID=271099 RepID=UPI00262DEFC4|nr:hypothetical protein [uncultured Shewanella sp.]
MRTLLFVICTLLTSFAQASSYVEGDLISQIQLQDQFENEITVSEGTRTLLFSRNMKGGDIIKEALETLTAEQKQANDSLVYVADISGMPSLIAKFVAIPQMKDLPFSMGLDREGETTRLLPSAKDQATLITLDHLKVVNVSTFDSSAALIKALR